MKGKTIEYKKYFIKKKIELVKVIFIKKNEPSIFHRI